MNRERERGRVCVCVSEWVDDEIGKIVYWMRC